MKRSVLAAVLILAFGQSVGGTPPTLFCTDFNTGAAAEFTGVTDTESVDIFCVIVDGNSVFLETFRDFDISDQSYILPSGVQLVWGAASGFGNWGVDCAYDMGLDPVFDNIPHSSNTLTMERSTTGEKWQGRFGGSSAIDNVEVLLKDAVSHGPLPIPEPSTVLPATRMATVPAPEKPAHEVEVNTAITSAKNLPQREYKKAYGEYLEYRYDKALTLFQDFLQRYPNHDLADNAQYWIGEIYYGLEDLPARFLPSRRL